MVRDSGMRRRLKWRVGGNLRGRGYNAGGEVLKAPVLDVDIVH